MPAYLLLGATYAFAAAVQPGPFQAYLISSTLAHGWRRTLPALLAPILSDIPVICLVLLVLTQVPPLVVILLRLAGGLFLLYLAAGAFTSFRTYHVPPVDGAAAQSRTVLKAAMTNLLNPNPYLAWSLVLGPLLLQAWRANPAYGIGLLMSFYVTMVVSTAVILIPFAGARALGPHVNRAMVGLSAVALAAFGLYQMWAGAASLLR
ncbi:MAG: LysE family transporter [Acidobacteria bacterium]|nr:LysE family transporter [Acidobacteriota bacterium]